MKNWIAFFKEKPRTEYEESVFLAVDNQLAAHKENHRAKRSRLAFLSTLSLAGLAGVVAIQFGRRRAQDSAAPEPFGDESLDLLNEIEMLEDLDVIEWINEDTGEPNI